MCCPHPFHALLLRTLHASPFRTFHSSHYSFGCTTIILHDHALHVLRCTYSSTRLNPGPVPFTMDLICCHSLSCRWSSFPSKEPFHSFQLVWASTSTSIRLPREGENHVVVGRGNELRANTCRLTVCLRRRRPKRRRYPASRHRLPRG